MSLHRTFPLVTSAMLVFAAGCHRQSARTHAAEPAAVTSTTTASESAVVRPPEPQPPGSIIELEVAFERAAATIAPSVVSITSERQARGTLPPMLRPFADPDAIMQGLGSGVIVDARGYILTNNHVVADADRLRVVLHDDREYDATVVGTDPKSDLAVIHIDASDLVPARLALDDELRVGQWVLAAGSPFGLAKSITAGIVSAVGRGPMLITNYGDFIQTDAAVNQGNSGGPLIDLRGRVVGINTAIASRDGGSNGIGFAIPIGMGHAVMQQLIDRGSVTRGWIGIVMGKLTPELAKSFGYDGLTGVLIDDLDPKGPAGSAGVKVGDIVVDLDGRKVRDMADFRNAVAQAGPGATVQLGVWRGGGLKNVRVTLATLPEDQARPSTRRRSPPPKKSGTKSLGVTFEDPDPTLRQRLGLPREGGALVGAVERGSIASSANLQAGDTVLSVGGTAVKSAAHAKQLLDAADLDEGVRIRVQSPKLPGQDAGYGHFVVLKRR